MLVQFIRRVHKELRYSIDEHRAHVHVVVLPTGPINDGQHQWGISGGIAPDKTLIILVSELRIIVLPQ